MNGQPIRITISHLEQHAPTHSVPIKLVEPDHLVPIVTIEIDAATLRLHHFVDPTESLSDGVRSAGLSESRVSVEIEHHGRRVSRAGIHQIESRYESRVLSDDGWELFDSCSKSNASSRFRNLFDIPQVVATTLLGNCSLFIEFKVVLRAIDAILYRVSFGNLNVSSGDAGHDGGESDRCVESNISLEMEISISSHLVTVAEISSMLSKIAELRDAGKLVSILVVLIPGELEPTASLAVSLTLSSIS